MSDVGDELAALAEAAGVAKATYQSKMATQSVDLAARNEWRLGASRAVSSTPTFFVNGARRVTCPHARSATRKTRRLSAPFPHVGSSVFRRACGGR